MSRARIATKISRSARWALVESLASASASALTVILLARYLDPADFGRAGLAVALTSIVQAALLGGMPDALVRTRSVHTRLSDALFWSTTAIGVGTALVAGAAALVVALLIGDRLLGALIAVQGLTGIALGMAAAPTGLLLRKLRTRALTQRTVIAKLAALAAGVAAAAAGAGPWALIVSNLVMQAAATMQLLATMRRPRLRIADPALAETLKLGILAGAQASLSTLTTRGFVLAYGAVYGPHAVGLFNFALRLVEESCGIVVTALRRVIVTSFAAAKRAGHDLAPLFRRGTRIIAYVSAPLFLGIAAVAPDAVPLIFGTQWLPAIPILQLMLALWVFRATRMLVNAIMVVDGRQRAMVLFGLAGFAATAAAFALSLPFGQAATTLAYAATLTGVVFGGRVFARVTGIDSVAQLAAGARPVIFAVMMAAAVTAARLGPLAALSPLVKLIVESAAGAGVFAALALAFDRDGWRDVVRTLRR